MLGRHAHPEVTPLPTLDSTRILARAALREALREEAPESGSSGPSGRYVRSLR
jgi:hypothetical protein